MQYIEFIKQSLQEASKIAHANSRTLISHTKKGDNNQVLTETDIAVGTYLVNRVKSVYPQHNSIDEEAGVIDAGSQYTWVIDPIDGTSNFAQGLPMFGIMLGLLENSVPIAGGIALPYFGEIYIAEKGYGAFCNDERLQVTDNERLLSALVAYGIDGHQEEPEFTYQECKTLADIVLQCRNVRASNSTAYDVVQVAAGKYGAYVNRTTKIWDNVAPHILIEEAGGVYTDFFGKQIDYSHPLSKANDNFTVCAAAPALHQQLQSIIHKNN